MSEPIGFVNGNGDERRTLVVVFLRGAADGLNMVVPVEDDEYYRARPTIGIRKREATALDGMFALNPRLAPLKRLYDEGELAIVHAVGSEDRTLSHFEAQDLMEHGGLAAGGWLGRFLRVRPGAGGGALSAVAIGRAMPEVVRGAPSVTVMESFEQFALDDRGGGFMRVLRRLYDAEPGALGAAGRDSLAAMERLEQLRNDRYIPQNGAKYPTGEFGEGMQRIAQLIRARVGLEAAAIDLDGWDSHFVQSTLMDPLMQTLGDGLAAFHMDLGKEMRNTTVVTMTEFGRRVAENTALGTDHGRASVMFAAGGGVRGGRVLCDWPGLGKRAKAQLGIPMMMQMAQTEDDGNVPVIHNYRNVLAPILAAHGAGDTLGKVFPDFALEPIPLYS